MIFKMCFFLSFFYCFYFLFFYLFSSLAGKSNFQVITPTCIRRRQDIAVWFKFFIKILLEFGTAFQDRQAGESAVNCLYQEHNRMARVGFQPLPCR